MNRTDYGSNIIRRGSIAALFVVEESVSRCGVGVIHPKVEKRKKVQRAINRLSASVD